MPRQARERSRSGIYHLILRGINKQTIFENDEDRQKFIETLGYYKMVSNYMLYGYCLMDNHIHLLIRENEESISQVIKRISSSYVYWYNQKYERCGHLFQERFKSEVIETDAYFLMALRYIHQNPIKAGIVKDIRKYLWSSYHEYTGTPSIINIDFALDMFSEDRKKAAALFKDHTKEKNSDACLDYEERLCVSDKEVVEYMKELGIVTISELQRLKREQRDDVIRKMKERKGVTIRQLARVTGISKSVIDRT
ncbi:transposase [Pelosinus fermentans]|uniref:Transposase IS200-family protein n=1 Tax=Pelosinus fermentans JBW45 TaxID=1192197 RepID=I9NQV4_9FIRM|nr:transposase [Pelosinus fermentans]AJQ26190.1 transposase IS200-family protein [Pelosinus fermentans JBW45]